MRGTVHTVAPLVGAWIEIPYDCDRYAQLTSLLSWERGLKSLQLLVSTYQRGVAPLVGAWIEINEFVNSGDDVKSLLSWERGLKYEYNVFSTLQQQSLLSWERGLKYARPTKAEHHNVAPLVGAWIEIE